jgi:hypothetical protein
MYSRVARAVTKNPVEKLGERPSDRSKEVHHELDERRAISTNRQTIPDADLCVSSIQTHTRNIPPEG